MSTIRGFFLRQSYIRGRVQLDCHRLLVQCLLGISILESVRLPFTFAVLVPLLVELISPDVRRLAFYLSRGVGLVLFT